MRYPFSTQVLVALATVLSVTNGCSYPDEQKPPHLAAEYRLPEGQFAEAVAFTPSGTEVVVASTRELRHEQSSLLFWELKSDKLTRTVAHPSVVGQVFALPATRSLLTCDWKSTFRTFGGEKWEIQETPRLDPDLPGASGCWASPDGKMIGIAHFGGKHGATLWEVKTGTAIRFPAAGKHPGLNLDIKVVSVGVSPDGKVVAVGYSAPRIDLFEVAGTKLVATLTVEQGHFPSVRFTPDGKRLLAGYSNKDGERQVLVWDVATQKLLHKCDGRLANPATELAVTPDSRYVLTCTHAARIPGVAKQTPNGVVSVWRIESGELVSQFDTGHPASTFALSPNGEVLVTAGEGTARRWDFAAIRKEFEAKAEKEKK